MSEYAIEVENLCISYKGMKSYSIKRNLFQKKEKAQHYEAVKNISFKVEKGEIVGIVGKNGSGKSTMLRAIAGIFSPNSGTIDLHGHSVSLLAIGVGFQKEMTGRENILLSGMLLGFSEKEIRARMDEIIEFSELGQFIDAPVRTYSSGMHSKLAFSITAILETDIMLIDEVLSVGDLRFKRKSYQKMKQLINDENRTVVIVSHERRTLSELCTKVLWINDGEFVSYGDTAEVLADYEQFMTQLNPVTKPEIVEFHAETSEEDVAYRWQFRNASDEPWRIATIVTSRTPTLKVPKTPGRHGRQYRCAITAENGAVRYSEVHILDAGVEKLEIAEFHANTSEADAAYQWQYRLVPNAPWRIATITTSRTPTLKVPKTPGRHGRQYRCAITDRNGEVRYSETFTMYVEQ